VTAQQALDLRLPFRKTLIFTDLIRTSHLLPKMTFGIALVGAGASDTESDLLMRDDEASG